MAEKLTLESPVVQEAKQRFERTRVARRFNLQFDDWFTSLLNGEMCKTIGGRYGLGLRRATYVYRYHFQSLFGKTGRVRLQELTRQRRTRGLGRLEEQVPKHSAVRIVADAARVAGCTVNFLAHTTRGKPQIVTTRIGINGRTYSVHDVQQKRKRQLIIAKTTLFGTEGHFALVRRPDIGPPNRIFFCPSKLARLLLKNTRQKTATIHLEKPLHGECPRAGVCVRGYEEATWFALLQLTKPRAE